MGADPVTMGIVLMAAGAVAGAYSSYRQTAAQKEAARYNKGVAQQNAQLQELQAQDAEARGRLEEDAYRKRLGQIQGSQATALAGTGVQLGTGSALDLRRDLDIAGGLDALAIRQNTAREAYSMRLGALSSRAQSRLHGLEQKSANPYQAAGLSLLGSAAQSSPTMYSMYKG
jgi:hypothetical protein